MKRVFLLVATNVAIMFMLTVITSLLGLDQYLTANGLNYGMLLATCGVMGMGSAFVSLAMSKTMAKMSTRAKIIEQPSNSAEAWLMSTVHRQARQAGIGMPEVAIYDSPDVNAFATGMNKNNALVAVSTGLLRQMSQDEIEAVLGHEVSHVANGDMVTLTLLQGVLNIFVMFFARIIGFVVDRAIFRTERGIGPGYWITVFFMQMVLGILASFIVAWFSRYREFHADAGGAHLAGRRKMIAALERLKSREPGPGLPEQLSAFGIAPNLGGSLRQLMASHPPLEARIDALRAADNPIS